MPADAPEIVTTTTEWIGLAIAAITCTTLLVGLLWKAFKIHDQIGDMAKELKPNHGGSLRDAVDALRSLAEDHTSHIAQIEVAAKRVADDNAAAHLDLHRRIDGVYALLTGPALADQRRIAEWHKAKRDNEEA